MNTLVSLLTIAIFILAVIYFAAKGIIRVMSDAEKKTEPEPSIMTRVDFLKTDYDRLNMLYDKMRDEFEEHKISTFEILQELNASKAQSHAQTLRIIELEKQIEENNQTMRVISEFEWAKWASMDKDGVIYAYDEKPVKYQYEWGHGEGNKSEELKKEQAIILCGKIPEWSDNEPISVNYFLTPIGVKRFG